MAIGFSNRFDFRPLLGWELYQVTIDKFHVMFWFENGHALMNIADRFSYQSADAAVSFTYEIYGNCKFMNVDRILRTKVDEVKIVTKEQLDLIFENGDVLSIYDNPDFRSWWFLDGREIDANVPRLQAGDFDLEEITEADWQERRR